MLHPLTGPSALRCYAARLFMSFFFEVLHTLVPSPALVHDVSTESLYAYIILRILHYNYICIAIHIDQNSRWSTLSIPVSSIDQWLQVGGCMQNKPSTSHLPILSNTFRNHPWTRSFSAFSGRAVSSKNTRFLFWPDPLQKALNVTRFLGPSTSRFSTACVSSGFSAIALRLGSIDTGAVSADWVS